MADDTYSRGYRNDPYDRGGASDSGPATDPLTELARLIGQSDPFARDRNRQPDPRHPEAYPQSAEWPADPAQHPQQYDPQHYDPQQPQHYDPQQHGHGAQDDNYGAAEPQHYADDSSGAADQYAAHQNGYAYPHAGQHEAGYRDNAGYAEQPYHQDQQAYQQERSAYQDDQRGYQDQQGQRGYQDQQGQQGYQAQQAYHPDQHPYYQDQPAHPQEEHQPAHIAQAGDAPERGEYAAAPADHPSVPGYPAPPFFGTDPNARPDDYYEDAPAPRRGWLVTAAALVGLAVVGTAGAFAYRAVFTGGEARIISRELAPNKITPAQATQDNGANKSERLASVGQNEKLGPPPEQPIAIPEPPRTVPPAITQNQAAAAPSAPAPAQPPAPSGPAQASPPVDTGGNAAPRKVRTEKINPQQVGDVSGPRPAGPPRNAGPSPVQPPQPRVVGPVPSANPNAPLSLAPSAPDPAPAPAREPRVHTTAVAPPPVERSSQGGGGYFVQLSAQKSEEEAKSSFRGIQARHSSLLGGQPLVVRRKDLGGKGVFYGAQVGPLSREAAGKLCEDLKAAGQSCMVQRN
jgi:hypothetical protein